MNRFPNCGNETDGKFCPECGSLTAPIPEPMPQPAPEPAPAPAYRPNPTYTAPANYGTQTPEIPEQYRPLSPWAYFGYTLLFAIPIVGFIMLIVFSCKKSNINRRNYARSYWCMLIVAAAIFVTILIIALCVGASFTDWFRNISYY